jgi:hypothetical protein
MLILSIFLLFTLYHLGSDLWAYGYRVRRNPRFWLQVLTVALVVYTASVVA